MFEHEEFCDEDHSLFEKCNTYGYTEPIGTCMGCGGCGIAGRICVRDGEECGEYL